MDRRIQPYDRKRWFQLHCCRSVVNPNPLPLPDIGSGFGLVMTFAMAVIAIGVMVHLMGHSASGAVLATALPVGLQELQGKLDHLLEQFKEVKEKGVQFEQKYGSLPANIAEQLTTLQRQVDAVDVKLAERHAADVPHKSVLETLSENEGLQRWMKDRPINSFILTLNSKQAAELFERKTTVDSAAVGRSTSGVLPIDRTTGIVQEARQELRLRDLLSSRPTLLSDIDYVKVNSAPARASMQTESSAKTENAVTFNTGTARVQTIATWIPASKQVLDDMSELLGYLRTALPYYVNLAEEVQMLTGSNTGQDLNGLVTQGTAYNTALNSLTPGWKQQDILARAIQQVQIAKEIPPTFVVLHPTDFWNIMLTKDSQGRYLNSGPFYTPGNALWGLNPIVSVNIGSGSFLVGSGNPAAVEIRDRMEMTLELSTQHANYFTQNLVAIRAEKRMTLVCYRPGSFIQGSFNTSP